MAFPFEEFIAKALAEKHSETYIKTTIEYAEKLDRKNLPVIFTRQHFAALLGMKSDTITEILQFRNNQYKEFSIFKKNGRGVRIVRVPERKLRYIQKWINKNILQKIEMHDCCTAFVKGTSLATNGYIHRNSQKMIRFDILAFFDTITEKRVYGFFKHLGYHPNVAYDLAQLTTVHPTKSFWKSLNRRDIMKIGRRISLFEATLPQGAPSSPQLANCIVKTLDYRLHKLATNINCRYSRYADDIVFSTEHVNGKIPSYNKVKKIIENEGFVLNEDKTLYMKAGMRQIVTGITVTHGFHIPKSERKEILKHIYYSIKYGPYNHLKQWSEDNNISNEFKYSFKDWLWGKICFVNSIDKKSAQKMKAGFNKIYWNLDESKQNDIKKA